MTSVAYSTSRWDGNLYRDTTRVLIYDVRDEPYGPLALPERRQRQSTQSAYRVELIHDKLRGVPCPERNGELTLLDAGPYRRHSDSQFHVKAQCSCGLTVFVKRSEWLNRTKKCRQRCAECSHRMQRRARP